MGLNMEPSSIVIETGPNPVASVIWLHGLGADGHDFEPVVPMLGLPGALAVRFIFPHAPARPITVNGGMVMRAWYDIRSITINYNEDVSGIRRSGGMLETLIIEQVDSGIPASRIVVAGFPRGAQLPFSRASGTRRAWLEFSHCRHTCPYRTHWLPNNRSTCQDCPCSWATAGRTRLFRSGWAMSPGGCSRHVASMWNGTPTPWGIPSARKSWLTSADGWFQCLLHSGPWPLLQPPYYILT